MKRYLCLIALAVMTMTVDAQALFGFFSRDSVLRSMNDYAEAAAQMEQLREQYDAETARAEEEFNVKFEDFLSEIHELAPAIAQKRQSELQDLMEKNIAFKMEARRLLEEAENDAFVPMHKRLSAALQRIGEERGFYVIINTDADACPFISPDRGEDITGELIQMLNERR